MNARHGRSTLAAAPSALVVEDDPELSTALAQALLGAGYRPHGVFTALEALRVIAHDEPDIVLLDLGLLVPLTVVTCPDAHRTALADAERSVTAVVGVIAGADGRGAVARGWPRSSPSRCTRPTGRWASRRRAESDTAPLVTVGGRRTCGDH